MVRVSNIILKPTLLAGLFVAAVLAAIIALGSTSSVSADNGATGCLATESGVNIVLTWDDNGRDPIIRRNGSWLASPGNGTVTYTDNNAPAGAEYVIRTRIAGVITDRVCAEVTQPPVADCTLTPSGSDVVLNWIDNGGNPVVRRNNAWLASPGNGATTYTDTNAPANADYTIRTWQGGTSTDRVCELDVAGPDLVAEADRVIHVSIDGLRSDYVTPAFMPNLVTLMNNGASTLNARTDPERTQTLPNHTSQFTGRPVFGVNGHQVEYNSYTQTELDAGISIHDEAGQYVSSVFDVVHDNGGDTALIAGKFKFEMMKQNWNNEGAADVTGADDGTQKIDFFDRDPPEAAITPFVNFMSASAVPAHGFYHIRNPDSVGHVSNWASDEYEASATAADAILGDLLAALDAAGIRGTTAIIVTSDHGGPTGGDLHTDFTVEENYTVPFIVEGPGVQQGVDLYALNAGDRVDPGSSRPGLTGIQPIRTHEVANLSLDLLGLPSVPGSTFNNLQDLDF